MSEARSRMAYGRAAVNFDVNESDFLVLLDDRVDTFESMAYRFPSSTDFEDYLKKTVRNKGAYRDSSGAIQVYTKAQGTPWDVFKSAEDTGCLRKLWSLAHQVSKKELETLASPGEETRQKVTLTMSQEWEERAISEGMPIALSDRERPGLICLGKVQAAYMTGGSFEYLNFECYMDAETEGRLKRAGRLPKDKQELVYSNDRITVKSKTDEMPKMEIIDATDMREILEIRARAFHMAKVCDFETCRQLTERYLSKLRATQVEGMRGPTINEVRRSHPSLGCKGTRFGVGRYQALPRQSCRGAGNCLTLKWLRCQTKASRSSPWAGPKTRATLRRPPTSLRQSRLRAQLEA